MAFVSHEVRLYLWGWRSIYQIGRSSPWQLNPQTPSDVIHESWFFCDNFLHNWGLIWVSLSNNESTMVWRSKRLRKGKIFQSALEGVGIFFSILHPIQGWSGLMKIMAKSRVLGSDFDSNHHHSWFFLHHIFKWQYFPHTWISRLFPKQWLLSKLGYLS